MKKIANNTALPKVYCTIFGHNYQITKEVTYHVKEYTCSHCKKELTTNSNGELTELTPKFKEINTILEHMHASRKQRLKNNKLVSSIY